MTTSQGDRATTADTASSTRVAWLFPSLERGNYWHPLFKAFSQKYPTTIIYTGRWPGFAAGFEGAFDVEVVGNTRLLYTTDTVDGYNRSYIFPSFAIVPKLWALRPQLIFTSAFSLWTLVALLFKLCFGSKVVVLFDGVSPGVDYLNSGIRVWPRRIMSKLIDAFVANSHAGKAYLTKVAWASPERVFVKTYLVPDVSVLTTEVTENVTASQKTSSQKTTSPQTTFLCVGQIVARKGLSYLLQACSVLKQQGYESFQLMMVGEGAERSHLETLAAEQNLSTHIHWLGAVKYHQLGAYFQQADVFVFPTLEDIWGMVVPEAMAFGNPVLCSQWAGAVEVMAEGDNGYIFDPYNPEQLAELMRQFIDSPELIEKMGDRSQQLAAELTPQSAATFFCDLVADLAGFF